MRVTTSKSHAVSGGLARFMANLVSKIGRFQAVFGFLGR